jgi:hypothetical protein
MDTITTIPSLLTLNGSASPATIALTPDTSRLIAAAPEMYAALLAVETLLWADAVGVTEGVDRNAVGAVVSAAARKAEGR